MGTIPPIDNSAATTLRDAVVKVLPTYNSLAIPTPPLKMALPVEVLVDEVVALTVRGVPTVKSVRLSRATSKSP
jgi:hypothetical protein